MKKYNITAELPYALGETVFIVTDTDGIMECQVRSFKSEIFKDGDELKAIAQAITAEYFCLRGDYFKDEGGDRDIAPLRRVFKTGEEAFAKAKFFPVDLNNEVWLKALGRRDFVGIVDRKLKTEEEKKYPIDESELGCCCASLSAVRDLLYKAQEKKGLVQLDIDLLVLEYEGCGDHDFENSPNLEKIFKTLKIENKS